jgi:hypothetical protein
MPRPTPQMFEGTFIWSNWPASWVMAAISRDQANSAVATRSSRGRAHQTLRCLAAGCPGRPGRAVRSTTAETGYVQRRITPLFCLLSKLVVVFRVINIHVGCCAVY